VQEDYSAELEALKNESEMPLEDLLQSLPAEMFNKAAEDEDKASGDQKVKLVYLPDNLRDSSVSKDSFCTLLKSYLFTLY